MAGIAVSIATPQGARFLASSSAREAALKAESVIATIAWTSLPVSVSVECANPDMADRLMNYLADVQMERLLAEVAWAYPGHASNPTGSVKEALSPTSASEVFATPTMRRWVSAR
ncbi:hypothetical protein [Methylobacterium sp. E-046]|uniref:hypothetical protein n=1 Tax=Methylobacterium sp. E-046 TaxID=2836576 RepID=UPI001FB9A4A6|nr:hypothetical protein [Methylobacterium sp. E-046]MCJ2102808.1 hypothetical protein [Methylobacterium sp. E-046]